MLHNYKFVDSILNEKFFYINTFKEENLGKPYVLSKGKVK